MKTRIGLLALLLSMLAIARFAVAGEGKTYRVPFSTVNGLILLDGQLNGKPAVLLLDTGAGPNFTTYEAAGLKPHEGVIEDRIEFVFGELGVACPARIVQGLQSPLRLMAHWEKIS